MLTGFKKDYLDTTVDGQEKKGWDRAFPLCFHQIAKNRDHGSLHTWCIHHRKWKPELKKDPKRYTKTQYKNCVQQKHFRVPIKHQLESPKHLHLLSTKASLIGNYFLPAVSCKRHICTCLQFLMDILLTAMQEKVSFAPVKQGVWAIMSRFKNPHVWIYRTCSASLSTLYVPISLHTCGVIYFCGDNVCMEGLRWVGLLVKCCERIILHHGSNHNRLSQI